MSRSAKICEAQSTSLINIQTIYLPDEFPAASALISIQRSIGLFIIFVEVFKHWEDLRIGSMILSIWFISSTDFDDLFMCTAYVRRVHDPEFPDAERFP